MPDRPLTAAESSCLKRLAQNPDAQNACTQEVLDTLIGRGLVEKRPLLTLPVNPPRSGYHLTAAGRNALAAAG